MPDWSAATPAFCYPSIAGTVLLLALISFLSVRAQLRGTAADALRPYTPKKMKKSICSSAINRRSAPIYDAPKSQVTGAEVCINIP